MAVAGEIAQLIVNLKLDDSGFTGKINNAGRALGRMETGLSRMGRGVGQLGHGLSTLGTRAALAAAGGLTAVVTTAASFEQAFTGVEKTVDGTDAQLAELEQTLRAMARSIPVSFEELSQIGEAGGALGVARESLDEFIDVVARLAVSTDLNAEAAATALGQLGTVLHLEGAEFEEFADSLVALGNAGASTESQIVELAARFAAAGNSAGLSKEEILALASATASMGIEVEAGGTALSQTFNGITRAIGTGSAEVEAFTDTLNISAAEFKKRWTQDALGTFQAFLGELAKLDKFEQASVLEKAGITGIRQTNAIMLMTQNLGFFSDQLDVATHAQGALDKESQKFFDTSVGQWKILVNNVRDVAATIGAELLPVANDLMKEFVGGLQGQGAQAGIKQFAKDLAEGVRGLVKELKGTDFSGIIAGLKLAAEVAKGAFDAFRALPEPIQQLAIAALVANKVSGGAIGQIAKGLGNIVFGGAGALGGLFARGASPANPMWVAQVGGVPGVGGAPAAAGGSLVATAAKFILGPAAAVIIGAEIAAAINEHVFGQARDEEVAKVEAVIASDSISEINHAIGQIAAQQNTDDLLAQTVLIASNIPFIGDALANVGPKLDQQRQALEARLKELQAAANNASSIASGWSAKQQSAYAQITAGQSRQIAAAQQETDRLNRGIREPLNTLDRSVHAASSAANAWSAKQLAAAAQMSSEQRNSTAAAREIAARVNESRSAIDRGFTAQGGYLATIAAKKFGAVVNVSVDNKVQISANKVVSQITRSRVATGSIPEFA